MSLFVSLGEKKNKVFLPSDYDKQIADGLVRMFTRNNDTHLVEDCIKRYILASNEVAFSISDFAMKLTPIYKDITSLKQSQDEVKKLLAETKKRMEQA